MTRPRLSPALALLAGTLAWPALGQNPSLDVRPAQGGGVGIVLQGVPLRDHLLEFSPDLARWSPLLSLRLPSASFQWSDPLAGGRTGGFYRLTGFPAGAPPAFASDFRLIDQRGRSRSLFYHTHLKAVVLLFVDPGVSGTLPATLSALESTFGSEPVEFWIIDSLSPSRADLVANAAAWQTGMPILHDPAQLVARTYQIDRGVQAVAIDTVTRKIFYRGATTRETAGGGPTQTYLADALTAFLAGQSPLFARTPASDYALPLQSTRTVSYAEEVAPILLEHCVRCHSPGNIAPFSLSDYQKVIARAPKIRRMIVTREMPPWFADPEWGDFENDWSLPDSAARTVIDWIDQGALRGTGPDPLADHFANTPPPSDYPVTWPADLGQPDLVVSIPTQNIPATGEVAYRYLEVRPNLPTSRYLRAAVIKPGNREVVHHSLVFLGGFFETVGQGAGLRGYFAGYVPGTQAYAYPEGTGKLLPANPTLTFQMHYQTHGQAETDRTELGLYFHATPPGMEYRTTAASTTSISIPGGQREYTREASVVLSSTQTTVLYEFSPHMHYRGARMEYDAVYPGGQTEKLLSVPHYLFDWQLIYRLAEPKTLPPGTSIRVRGAFDNSPQNPFNPNPGATVGFGEQSDDEMFIGYINFALPR